jgi:hypothetical protein
MNSNHTTRRFAVAGLCALAAGIAAAPSAHAATVQVDLGPAMPVIGVDTQVVQSTVAGVQSTVAGVRDAAVQRVQQTLSQANRGVVAPTTARLTRALRNTGVSAFAIVDRTGRVVRGPGVVSVSTTRGVLDIGWANDHRGCVQVALSNTLVPQVLNLDLSMPLHTRVISGRAATKASLRNLSVAVVC